MNNDVQVTMNATTSQAQQAWLQFVGVVEQATQRMERLSAAGQHGGGQTAAGLKGAERAAANLSGTLGSLVRAGGSLFGMATLATTIRSELEKVAQLTKQSQDFGLRRSEMLGQLAQPLGAARTDSRGQAFGVTELERYVSRKSAASGIPQEAILKAIGPMLSADTSGAADEIIDLAYEVAQYDPRLALPSAEEELRRTGMGILELKKAAKMKGQRLTNSQLITGFMNLYQQSRADELTEFARSQIPAISGMVADRPQESIEGLAAVMSVIEQVAVDTEGRRTATNMPVFRADLLKSIATHAPELRNLPFNELRRRLRDATPEQGGVYRARQQLLGQYLPGITDAEVMGLAEKEGSITGESRMRGISRAMLLKGSMVDRMIDDAEKSNADLFAPERVAATRRAQERTNRSGALLGVQQERARLFAKEMGDLSRQREAQRVNILETTIQVLRDTQAIPLLPNTYADAAEYLMKHFGTDDPEQMARGAMVRMDHLQAELQARLQEEPDPLRRRSIQTQREQAQGHQRELARQLETMEFLRREALAEEAAQRPPAPPTSLEQHPEHLRRTPFNYRHERAAAQRTLRGEVEQILTSEGMTGREAERIGRSVFLNANESPEKALRRVIEQYDRPFAPGPKFDTLAPQTQDQERATHAAQLRAMQRLRRIVEPAPDRTAAIQQVLAQDSPANPAAPPATAESAAGPLPAVSDSADRAAGRGPAVSTDAEIKSQLAEQTAALKRMVEILERSGLGNLAQPQQPLLPPLLPLVIPLPGGGR